MRETVNETLHGLSSGAAHYFRTLPEQWPNRLASLRALGLNTVETYLAWNFHERREGEWRRLEQIPEYLDVAADVGLQVIVRPGPYICAEWDNGGLPMWVTRQAGRLVRTSDPRFMDPVRRYLDKVVPLFAEHPALALVQVENEYGSWGTESAYLRLLADELRSRGIVSPLVTSDGPSFEMLSGGTIEGVTATVNFGSRAREAFTVLEAARPGTQPFCMEFWDGWFDHWGKPRVTRDAVSAASTLEEILLEGGGANLYMAHGGTNFGTFAGANQEWRGEGAYHPTVTSYDYDAPLNERGEPTPKFFALREVYRSHGYSVSEDLPTLPPLMPAQSVPLTQSAMPDFEPRGTFPVPPSFEDLDVDHGLVRYSTRIPGPRDAADLVLRDVRDWALVSIDGRPWKTIDHCGEAWVGRVGAPAELAVLVESMGRVNYGPHLGDWKGLGAVAQDYAQLNTWTVETLSLPGDLPDRWEDGASGKKSRSLEGAPDQSDVSSEGGPRFAYKTDCVRTISDGALAEPCYFRGALTLDEVADGYVDVVGGVKGYLWVNGFCLGRYWSRGPQRSLFVPAPLTQVGENEVVILELESLREPRVAIVSKPDLGPTT